jgi:hypothetical protein
MRAHTHLNDLIVSESRPRLANNNTRPPPPPTAMTLLAHSEGKGWLIKKAERNTFPVNPREFSLFSLLSSSSGYGVTSNPRQVMGREGKGREGKGREGKGREGKAGGGEEYHERHSGAHH